MIRTIFRGHTTAGGRLNAADIGYHFFVDRNGEVWEARSASKLGTHVGSTPIGLNNTGNIGICGLGTFLHQSPPKPMVESIVNLSRLVSDYYDRPLGVRGHEDWVGINRFFPRGGIDCPGRLENAVTIARTAIKKEFNVTETQVQASLKETKPPTRVARAGK